MAAWMRSDGRRLLLVLALVAGVLGMHALVVSGHGAAGHGATSAHVVAPAAAPGHGPAAMEAPVMVAAGVAAERSEPIGTGTTEPSSPADAAHHVLHLCLAVLAALVATVVLALVASIVDAGTLPQLLAHCHHTTPARPPPRSAVRLALLCVLRN